jgi:hypothetical protein
MQYEQEKHTYFLQAHEGASVSSSKSRGSKSAHQTRDEEQVTKRHEGDVQKLRRQNTCRKQVGNRSIGLQISGRF